MMAKKSKLTFEEKIKAAYLHFLCGISQQNIAIAFNVNIGRINEAVSQVKAALK
jgi:hypothetical protein